ncbi:MAG: glutaredoxin family protein [Candidatus Tectomicrobia bacterium]|nr:glutaredoxin family protein [Candidatus Tectomicrobia bacterium]
MKEFLSAHGIDFTALDVAQDPEALADLQAATGRQATPVIMVGNEVVIGFDRGRLQRLLHLTSKGSGS